MNCLSSYDLQSTSNILKVSVLMLTLSTVDRSKASGINSLNLESYSIGGTTVSSRVFSNEYHIVLLFRDEK